MHGDDAVNKTGMLLEQANANAAAQQVKQAMKHYRNALRKAYKDNPEALEESGNETDPDLPPTGEPVNQTEISEAKMTLIQQFQENFQERVMSMEEAVNSMMNELSDKDAQKAADALERTERKLLRIQERLNRGEIDEAIGDLENATDGLDDDLGSFEDQLAGQMLRTMNKMEARAQRMVYIMNKKAAKGLDTSEDEDARSLGPAEEVPRRFRGW
jgi:tetratricopeptide (TPR) repeat protein